MLLAAILLMGIATAIYIGVDAGAGPRDSLMLAVKRTSGWSLRRARGSIEVTLVLLGWLLGGPAGIGTVVFAVLIGPAVQWSFKLFNVVPHHQVEPEPAIIGLVEHVLPDELHGYGHTQKQQHNQPDRRPAMPERPVKYAAVALDHASYETVGLVPAWRLDA